MAARMGALIDRAYEILGDRTPLADDCGQLCGAACCAGDLDAGMLLFPGEAPRLWRVPGFVVSRIDYMGAPAWLLNCPGLCDRSLRPLACRIFPLGPRLDARGRVRAVPDPRGRGLCPLADGQRLDPRFWRRVDRVFQLLAQEPRMLELMGRISLEIRELEEFC